MRTPTTRKRTGSRSRPLPARLRARARGAGPRPQPATSGCRPEMPSASGRFLVGQVLEWRRGAVLALLLGSARNPRPDLGKAHGVVLRRRGSRIGDLGDAREALPSLRRRRRAVDEECVEDGESHDTRKFAVRPEGRPPLIGAHQRVVDEVLRLGVVAASAPAYRRSDGSCAATSRSVRFRIVCVYEAAGGSNPCLDSTLTDAGEAVLGRTDGGRRRDPRVRIGTW